MFETPCNKQSMAVHTWLLELVTIKYFVSNSDWRHMMRKTQVCIEEHIIIYIFSFVFADHLADICSYRDEKVHVPCVCGTRITLFRMEYIWINSITGYLYQ